MVTGGRGRLGRTEAHWRDMSEHVVHVVRGSSATESYGNIISILASGVLFARNPFGAARGAGPDAASQNCVCFSEVSIGVES